MSEGEDNFKIISLVLFCMSMDFVNFSFSMSKNWYILCKSFDYDKQHRLKEKHWPQHEYDPKCIFVVIIASMGDFCGLYAERACYFLRYASCDEYDNACYCNQGFRVSKSGQCVFKI